MNLFQYKMDLIALINERIEKHQKIRYSEIYDLFDSDLSKGSITKREIWDLFEEASEDIIDHDEAIIGVLLENNKGFPGDGFFDIYQWKRQKAYNEKYSGKNILELTEDEKREIVNDELSRLYNYFPIK